jgi:hypothetical protein
MSHIKLKPKSYKKTSKKNKHDKKKSYKNSKKDTQKSRQVMNKIKEFNMKSCMRLDDEQIKEMAKNKNIIFNASTSKIDLCTKLTTHQRNIFVGKKLAPFLKQQIFSNNIFSNNIFKNNINNSLNNSSDCSLCKV